MLQKPRFFRGFSLYRLYTLLYKLYTFCYSLYTTSYKLYTKYYRLYTLLYKLYTFCYSLYTICYRLYTILYRKNSLYNSHYIAISGCIKQNIVYMVLAKKPIIQGTNSSIYEIYRKSNT